MNFVENGGTGGREEVMSRRYCDSRRGGPEYGADVEGANGRECHSGHLITARARSLWSAYLEKG
jgi:hypothetical protein